MIPRNSPGKWKPIDHRPPLPRIEAAKPTPAPEMIPPHLQVQIDHAQRMERLKEGERIWALVEQSATGG